MRRYLLPLLIFVVCAYGAFHLALQKSFVNPYPVVCDFVAEKIYLDDSVISDWKKTCLKRSQLVTPSTSKALILKDINNVLSLLKVSHLEIYNPSEVKEIWNGEAKETGIESQFVDSELVIFKIHPGSPAQKVGLKVGDVIVQLNKSQPSPWTAQTEAGNYEIKRAAKSWTVVLKPAIVNRDEKVEVKEVAASKSVLKIPSFRAEFFSDTELKKMATSMQKTKYLIVDLRGNAGGNFVAGLRFLSLFMCEPTEIGSLVRPRFEGAKAELPNELKDEEQLKVLNSHREVVLKTFPQSPCFTGRVRVLVDGKSASVAEMVAQALKERRGALIEGAPSRGQLLVGVWYPMDEVAPGVQISIPEAIYESVQKYRIEGQGVQIDKVLYYYLPEMQAGVDSWVKRALD
ncbi:S41 family peptidase [Bdellovibrio sp. HCB2-146]|uniref:S41 family peptidase n=1 Tax=Bdellovibrio sp. HCB2-146 TaxID=3394362 RepID=UPI0039BC8DC5